MFSHANKQLIIIALLILISVMLPIVIIPKTVVSVVSILYNFITQDLAWFLLSLGVVVTVATLILLTTKYGDIRLGGKNAKPHYNTFTWVSMNLCSALAAGVLIFGLCEWMYYINTPPFGIEKGSVLAYEHAISYGMFHWGFSAWAFYLVPGLAIGYLYWNKKGSDLRISNLCSNILAGNSVLKKMLRATIDPIIVFGYFMSIMTTVGIGTPVIAELASHLLGVENSFAMKIGVILIFGFFFTLSTSKTIAKGMGIISNFNVKLSLAFFAFIILMGDTTFILNNLTMSVGKTIRDFVQMSFNTDAVAQTGFIQGWTIFYWAWYVALTFICGIWIARTSYGRTFKEVAIANCIWGALACWITFGTLGSYAMGQELLHGVNLSEKINQIGNNGVTLMVLETLPLPQMSIAIFMILIFFSLATTVTANGTALSIYTSSGLGASEEPNAKYKTFWCLLFLVIPVGILLLEKAIPSLNVLKTIQSMITISALPMFVALVVLFLAFFKAFQKDVLSGEILNSIDPHKQYKWHVINASNA